MDGKNFAVGIGAGVALGVAMGSVGTGIAIGVAIALALGSSNNCLSKKDPPADTNAPP